jgi:hypothetical protein
MVVSGSSGVERSASIHGGFRIEWCRTFGLDTKHRSVHFLALPPGIESLFGLFPVCRIVHVCSSLEVNGIRLWRGMLDFCLGLMILSLAAPFLGGHAPQFLEHPVEVG